MRTSGHDKMRILGMILNFGRASQRSKDLKFGRASQRSIEIEFWTCFLEVQGFEV